MKFDKILICFLGTIIIPIHARTQEARIDTGRIGGAMYRIIIPANWNHNLVMYAHGYEMPTQPNDPKIFHGERNDLILRPFLDRGFAVARSAYRKKGWALVE